MTLPLKVMHSIAPPEEGKTRFIDHLVEGAPPDLEVRTFTWKGAFLGGYDVFHIHWPERLYRRGPVRTLTLLALLRMRKVPIVRTLHNMTPHERGGRLESMILRLVDYETALFIRLNEHTPLPTAAPSVVIPHPHYLPRVSSSLEHKKLPGRVLYFGIVRPYKGVQSLLDAFGEINESEVTLRIVGSAVGTRGDGVRAAMCVDPRITARLEYVSDAELDEEIGAAEIVVLPYRHMHNSGAMLLALSHNRPVLVPRNEVNSGISKEVGQGWVYQFDGDLSGTQILNALRDIRRPPNGSSPDLRARDWDLIGQRLKSAYAELLKSRVPGK